MLDQVRDSARAAAEWLARQVDGWFGDQPFDEGGKVSNGRLSLGWLHRKDQGSDVDLRFDADFRLPNARRHTYLFIGRDEERDAVRDRSEGQILQQQALSGRRSEPSLRAGLGLRPRDSLDFRLGLGSRARPYAQARWRKPWAWEGGHELEFRQIVFWTVDDRLGTSSSLHYHLALTPTLALRWDQVATLTRATRNLEWSSTLGANRSFEGQRLLTLQALFSGSGTQGTGVGASDHGLLLTWSQPVQRQDRIGEVSLGRFWPRRDARSDHVPVWVVGARLTLRF